MPTQAEERFANAVRGVLARAVTYHGERPEYGEVTSVNPLTVDLTARAGDPLTEDELRLGHTVRQYDADYGIAVGDTLVLHLQDDGDYSAVEVLHDKAVTAAGGGA